ncbi:MAG: glycosyltransferase family 39 protein [Candidatus Omnitrophica bacterium]|nr:glycosyltransferase family 39 protein [Candidatus Omnitrophota bacterium]
MSRIRKIKSVFYKIVLPLIFLLAVLLSAALIRANTFWLPHWSGDQSQYIALAVKLDKWGFDGYNLRGVRRLELTADKTGLFNFIYVIPTEDPQEKGDILRNLDMIGVHYYDQPFFHKPPGFPYALLLSHRLFAAPDQPYIVVLTNFSKVFSKIRPAIFFVSQFWAAIVPFFFSIGLVFLTFFLGKILFSSRIGLYAAALMAINPVNIMTSQKLWADDMLAFFVCASIISFVIAYKRNLNWLIFLAGAFCGLAVLVKQFAAFILVGLWFFYILIGISKFKKPLDLFKIVFSRQIFIFTAGVILISGYWFFKVYQVYGTPFFIPERGDVVNNVVTTWFKTLANRPPGLILYPVGWVCLCPLLVFAYASLGDLSVNIFRLLKNKVYDYRFVFLWMLILVFYAAFSVTLDREHRYMMPIYPALAILSAYYLDRLRRLINRCNFCNKLNFISELIIVAMIVGCGFWSVPIGLDTALNYKSLILMPF